MQKQSGKLNKFVEIWKKVKTGEIDAVGGDETVDTLLFKRWANMEPRTGSLLMGRAQNTMLSKTTHKIIMRYSEEVTPGCWIVYNGHRFDIDYILPDFKKEWLEIYAQEVI